MKFSFKKLLGSLVLKQNQKEAQVDFLDKNQKWQTQKQSPELYDQGAIPKILDKKEFQFFPTPEKLAEKLGSLAELKNNDSILEPCLVKEVKEKKLTKIDLVKKHLQENGSIDSWTAINMYRATRLSAIIFDLKNVHGMNIESIIDNESKSHFATYILK